MTAPDKTAILNALITALEDRLHRQMRASEAARAEATDEDNVAESKYDTRALEAGYLANGQALQAAETAEALEETKRLLTALEEGELPPSEVAVCGSVVALKRVGQAPDFYFISTAIGGFDVEVNGAEVTVLSPESPLALKLLGTKAGTQLVQPRAKIASIE